MKSKRLLILISVILFLLFIPLIAMQFSEEVNCTITDFFVMGILLTGIGLLIELTLRTVKTKKKQNNNKRFTNSVVVISLGRNSRWNIWDSFCRNLN